MTIIAASMTTQRVFTFTEELYVKSEEISKERENKIRLIEYKKKLTTLSKPQSDSGSVRFNSSFSKRY